MISTDTLSAIPAPAVRPRAAAGDASCAALLASLQACLADESVQLGNTRPLAEWLRVRHAGLLLRAKPGVNAGRFERLTARIARGISTSLSLHAQLVRKAHGLRREALSRLLARVPPQAQDRAVTDCLRTEVAEALQALDRSLREHCRRAQAGDGGVQARMVAEVSRLGDADFARETTRQAIVLTLRREFMGDLQRSICEVIKQDLSARLNEAHAVLADLEVLVGQTLRDEFGAAGVLMPRWQPADLLERLQEGMQLNVRYRGTLPRRGFLQRLAEGRKSIFTVLMFTSLFGSFVGFNWRTHPALGWLFMAGFVVMVSWTFTSWRDDERERLDEELEKAREQLRMEARRLLAEAYRDQQLAWSEAIENARRMLVGQVEEAARTTSVLRQREFQAQREQVQSALRQLDADDVALAAWQQRLARVDSELSALLVQRA